MIFVKSTLAGVAALIVAALITYGLALGVPRILGMMPGREDSGMTYGVLFPMWRLVVVALLIFSGGFYWGFRRAQRHRQKIHKG